jgi:hypothetical protein
MVKCLTSSFISRTRACIETISRQRRSGLTDRSWITPGALTSDFFLFLGIPHSLLIKIADNQSWNKRTYNNAISALRRTFNFGYLDYPDRRDPAAVLKRARIGKRIARRSIRSAFRMPKCALPTFIVNGVSYKAITMS